MYLMYLRKSRADDPNETVEEVLSKHEMRLQNFMHRKFGYTIPEENIYREVCSAESIAERVEIKKVLLRIEDADVEGVLVADVPRLSRGNLGDCHEIISKFLFTKTLVMTDTMTFNLENKRDRQYFQDELLRGAYYLEYVKDTLRAGRENSVQNKGCYIAPRAPFGYNKIKIGKNPSLEPNKDADIVRLMFEWYANDGLSFYQVACRLNDMGISAPMGAKWKKDTVKKILKNPTYDGKVTWGAIKGTTLVEDGEIVKKRLSQNEYILADGLHPAIIDHDLFVKAQEKREKNPSTKQGYALKNIYAGILKCGKCGRAICIHPYSHAESRYECREKPMCMKSIKMSTVEDAIVMALEQAELPKLEAKVKNDDGNAFKIKKSLLANLEKELEDYKVQEEKQYEFLETGRYTEEVFDKRHAILCDKMEECKKKIRETQLSMPKEIDYQKKIITLKEAIQALKSDASPAEKNRFVKRIVERIDLETWDTGKHGKVGFKLDIFLKL